MAKTSIIQRWIKGSLLIMVLVLFAAEAIFLYNSYRELYLFYQLFPVKAR